MSKEIFLADFEYYRFRKNKAKGKRQKGKSKLDFFPQGIYVPFLNNKSLNLNKKTKNSISESGNLHLSSLWLNILFI